MKHFRFQQLSDPSICMHSVLKSLSENMTNCLLKWTSSAFNLTKNVCYYYHYTIQHSLLPLFEDKSYWRCILRLFLRKYVLLLLRTYKTTTKRGIESLSYYQISFFMLFCVHLTKPYILYWCVFMIFMKRIKPFTSKLAVFKDLSTNIASHFSS